MPEGFITADTLAEQESEASALQAELEAVRQLLDRQLLDPSMTAPPTPFEVYADDAGRSAERAGRRPGHGRSRKRIAVLALFVLIFMIGLVLAALALSRSGPFASASSVLPGAIPTGSPANGAQGARIVEAEPVRGLPTAGPGIDQAGAALGVQVLADQSIAVTEQALLTPPGLGTFKLAMPELKNLTRDAAKLNPAIDDLKITINGEPATAKQTNRRTWTVTSPTGPALRVQLTYRLTDAVAISQPSSEGRALAVVTPLLAQLLHKNGEPVELRIPAASISNVTCIGASQAESQCGAQQGMNWAVTIPDDASSAAVLLQLNLR